jgi:hypothetical protein
MPVMALGCQTTKVDGCARPAPPKYVGLADVARGLPGPVGLGDPVLQPDDPFGLTGAVPHAGQSEQSRDMLLVLGADLAHRRGGVGVVGPVGQAESALQQEGGVVGGIVQVLRHPETEQVLGVEIGAVECVDIGPQCGAEELSQLLSILNGGNGVEGRLERLEGRLLDGGRVHEGGVVVSDLPPLGSRGSGASSSLLNQLRHPAVREVRQDGAGAIAGLVGRDLGVFEPGAVGVSKEVIARFDRAVHPGKVDPDGS